MVLPWVVGPKHAKDMLLKCPSKYNEENRITG